MQKETETKAIEILDTIWKSIDFESMSNSRKKEIWSEFKNKVKGSALKSNTISEFVEAMCKKFNISVIEKDYNKILEVYEENSDFDILEAYRNNLMIIIFKLRMLRETAKEEYAANKKTASRIRIDLKELDKQISFPKGENDDDEYFAF